MSTTNFQIHMKRFDWVNAEYFIFAFPVEMLRLHKKRPHHLQYLLDKLDVRIDV